MAHHPHFPTGGEGSTHEILCEWRHLELCSESAGVGVSGAKQLRDA